ncbi:MAG: hypothetical protein II485_04680, partial [Firmicutes bacterium]|nr:hypothetical protein [Bacillota bacterium]
MKKLRPAAAFLLVLILVFSSASPAFAKDLEPCYHCGSTGRFECPNCHNQVQITCDGCNGAGGSKCDGEEGKGPCDNGYYTCPSCHGDTYIRNGDGEIPKDAVPGSCGTCGGKGKLECWHCHGAYWIVCNRCGGSGEVECQNENCKESRKIGWKCHYCMGTGYLLTNFWPGENDGVQNKPEKGDKIWVNGKSSTYGESGSGNGSGGSGGSNGSGNGSGGGNSSQGGNSGSSASTTPRYDSSGSNIARDPSNGRDFIWFVDTGSGTWEFGGRTFTLTRGGKTVSGIVDLKFNENIYIDPGTGGTDDLGGIHAYLTGSGGFKVELERSGDGGIAVGRHTPSGQYIPFNVSLVLEYSAAEDNTLYTIDLAGGHWDVGGRDVTATINGQPAAGIVRISQWESIKFHGIDRDTMKVCLRGENDFRIELELSGSDEASIGRYSPADAVLPPEGLYISIEHTGAAGPGGEDLVHTVDFAGGHWDVDGKDVTAYVDGLRAEGIRELTENDNIKLNGFDRDTMKVRVYSDDGFSAGLEVNGDDEARLGLCDDPEAVLPPELHFVIEQRDDISDDNRTFEIDFGSGSWDIEGAGRPVVAWIDGHTAQGVVEIRGTDRIFLEDFDGGFMQARVYADDGFSVILNHTGDNEVFLDSYLGDADGLPEKLHFVIEQIDEDNKTYSIAIKGCYVAQSSILWKELRNIANNLEIRVMMLDDEAEVLFEIPSHYGSIRIYNITEASEMQLLGTFKDPKYYNPKYLNVFVQDSNGTVAELIPDANNVVCLARRAPADVELSGELALYFAP